MDQLNLSRMSSLKILASFVAYLSLQHCSVAFTLPILLIIYALYIHCLDQTTKNAGPKIVKTEIHDDSDTFDWLNRLLTIFWLDYRSYAHEFFRNEVWPHVKEELNDVKLSVMWKDLILNEFYIGDQPPKIVHIQSWMESNDLLFDVEFTYSGNAYLKVGFDMELVTIPVILQNIRISNAKVRIVTKNWNHQLPFISGLHFGFIEAPQYDWDISNLAGIADIPGFDEFILHLINTSLTKRIILPRMLIYPVKIPKRVSEVLNKHFSIRQTYLSNDLMLKPLVLIRVVLQSVHGVLSSSSHTHWPFKAGKAHHELKAIITLGEQSYTSNINGKFEWDFEAIFAVEHIYKQSINIKLYVGHDKYFGQLHEDVARIVKKQIINDLYSLENNSGKLKLIFEAIPVTNQRRAITETRPYGVLSILLKHVIGSIKTRPIIYLCLEDEEEDKVQNWTSLERLYSAKKHYINEGTLMYVSNVLSEKATLSVRVWNERSFSWVGPKKEYKIKDLLKQNVQSIDDLVLSNEQNIVFSFSMSLYHV